MSKRDYLRTSSLDAYAGVNFRNLAERDRYNRLLLGTALRSEVGQDSEAANPTARPPSWTQHHAGSSQHAFAWSALSSSRHEVQVLNAYLSGTEPKEQSSVPASGSMFYSKKRGLVRKTYKLSASADLGTFVAASGTIFESQVSSPTVYTINVPDYGRIVDIKVWIEAVTWWQPGTPENSNGLGNLFVGIRNSNVNFKSGLPVLNDPKSATVLQTQQRTIPHCFPSMYILWEGRLPDTNTETATWTTDHNIRTVFWDASRNLNPRHFDLLYASGSSDHLMYHLRQGAPNHEFSSSNGFGNGVVAGNGVSWFSDTRVSKMTEGAAGSPPAGWLTGPGGSADENEFATTGSNIGPNDMIPVYPLLDDVYEFRPYPTRYYLGVSSVTGSGPYVGFRPGLRGKEIHGDWNIVLSSADNAGLGPGAAQRAYFRQARIEILFDQNKAPHGPVPRWNTSARPGKKVVLHRMSGTRSTDYRVFWPVHPQPTNPSQAWGLVEHEIYTVAPDHPGRTFGITDDTGSLKSGDFAVFTRITGALADHLTGSQFAHSRWKFLNNEFGTPYISPLSASAIEPRFDAPLTRGLDEVIDIVAPKPKIGRVQKVRDVVSRTNPKKTAARRIAERTSGSR